MTDNYVEMLKDSLLAKKEILEKLLMDTEKQKEIVSKEEVDWKTFDSLVDEKAELIEKLSGLDEGFDAVYNRMRENILANQDYYKNDIQVMQKLIQEVTDKSTSLMALEERNRVLVTNKFQAEKRNINQKRNVSKAAGSYYQSMNRINNIDPQLMDHKK